MKKLLTLTKDEMKKLLTMLFLITGQVRAMEPMELTIDDAMSKHTETITIQIQGQKIKLPTAYILLMRSLSEHAKEIPLEMPSINEITLEVWKLIEDQLKRVYAASQGNLKEKEKIFSEYQTLNTTLLIALITAVDFLNIALLKEITLEVAKSVAAKNKLTFDELLGLPEYARNEIIKGRALSLCGPFPARKLAICKGHESVVMCMSVMPDEEKIVSSSLDGTVRIWDMDGKNLIVFQKNGIGSFKITSDNNLIINEGSLLSIRDMSGQKRAICRPKYDNILLGMRGIITRFRVTPNGKIITGSLNGTVHIWNLQGQEQAVCKGHDAKITSIKVTLNGKIISGDEDGTVRIWSKTGKALAICKGKNSAIYIDSSPHDNNDVHSKFPPKIIIWSDEFGDRLLTWDDKTVCIWEMNGKQLALCQGHEDAVCSIAVTSNGKIVSGSFDRTIRIWDMGGQELAICKGHEGWVISIKVTLNDKIISNDRSFLRIWDMNGQEVAVCKILQFNRFEKDGNKKMILTSPFPDMIIASDTIISGYHDGIARIWDLNGQQLALCHGKLQSKPYISPDNKIVVACDNKYRLNIWDISLLNRLSGMNWKQAESVWQILQSSSDASSKKQNESWQQIWSVFTEDELATKSQKKCTLQ